MEGFSKKYHAPIVCCGDLTHKWNEPPEFINFLLRVVPFMYCVRGNHDTPWHNGNEMNKSVYGTLVFTNTIKNLDACSPIIVNDVWLHGFPHGTEVTPCVRSEKERPGTFRLAVIHSYIWKKGCAHPQVTEDSSLASWQKKVAGFNAAVFGDNHIGFRHQVKGQTPILNCGAMIRRNKDEVSLTPSAGLIYSNGEIRHVPFDTSGDVFAEEDEVVEDDRDEVLNDYLDQLKNRCDTDNDFKATLLRKMDQAKASSQVKEIILKSME